MFKPMLACDADLAKLTFPLFASPKLDGVRAIIRDGVVYSRSNKPIPNAYIQKRLGEVHFNHLDGELIVGSPTDSSCYRNTMSGVMTQEGTPNVHFYVFDNVEKPASPYYERRLRLATIQSPMVVELEQLIIPNMDALLTYEQKVLDNGYEGLILRRGGAPYKNGRSTVKEGYLLKLKRFQDAEATVIGFEERLHNGNEATINELGRTSRSSHQANKTGRGDLGALVVKYCGIQFNIGTGFTDEERADIWKKKDYYIGRLVKFKYFAVGVKEAPRHPVFLGWRDKVDL